MLVYIEMAGEYATNDALYIVRNQLIESDNNLQSNMNNMGSVSLAEQLDSLSASVSKINTTLSSYFPQDSLSKALHGTPLKCGTVAGGDLTFFSIPGLNAINEGTKGLYTSDRTGWEIELIKALELLLYGVPDKIMFVPRTSSGRISEMYNGNFDFGQALCTKTLKRTVVEGAQFTEPYYYDGQGVVMNKNSFDGFTDLDGNVYSSTNLPTVQAHVRWLINEARTNQANYDFNMITCTCSFGATTHANYKILVKKIDPTVTDELIEGRLITIPDTDEWKKKDENGDFFLDVSGNKIPDISRWALQKTSYEPGYLPMVGILESINDCTESCANGTCAAEVIDNMYFECVIKFSYPTVVSALQEDGSKAISDEPISMYAKNGDRLVTFYNIMLDLLKLAHQKGVTKENALTLLDSPDNGFDSDEMLMFNGKPFEDMGASNGAARVRLVLSTVGNIKELLQSNIDRTTDLYIGKNKLALGFIVGESGTFDITMPKY